MKYIIEIENTPFDNPERDLKLYKCTQFKSLVFDKEGLSKLTPYTEPDQKAIEDEVWEFVDKLLCMKYDETRDCFGRDISFVRILNKCSYQEAKSKYEAWKKQKEAIHVGDEVFHKDYPNDKVVVTRLYQSGYLCADILFPNGETDQEILVNNLVKTGRHFPEVEELLKKIKENK